MAVNNEVGTIQDIPRIAEMLAPHGVPLHCDAAQAPCAMDVSNLAVQADLVSLSGHKVYGPMVCSICPGNQEQSGAGTFRQVGP